MHKTKILYVALYGCEILSLTLKEADILTLPDNRVLKRKF